MANTLRTFWHIKLKFLSPIHVGAGSLDGFLGASEPVKNGAGEYMIPGTSLAGLFFSRLRCLVNGIENDPIFKKLTKDQDSGASHLIFRSITLDSSKSYLRDRVRINPETKTAEDKGKFSQWELRPDSSDTILEFDNCSKTERLESAAITQIKAWVELVLRSWHQEGFFIGAHSAVGNGKTRLISARKCDLTKANYKLYLDSPITELHNIESEAMGWEELEKLDVPISQTAFCKRYKIKLSTGLQDPLLIKGNLYYPSKENPDTDAPFINRDGEVFIPGSSIRGAVSAFMHKYGISEWGELAGQYEDKDRKQATASSIIFTDLSLTNAKAARQVQIERHEEDQLSRAIYQGSKFDEERIFNAEFEGEIYIQRAYHSLEDEGLDKIFNFIKDGMKYRLIGLGAGSAHPQMSIEEIS